jgi:hypothetical protein
MMKRIMPILLVVALTTTSLLAGCTTTVPGGLITEDREFTDFTSVEVGGTFEVEISRSDQYSITVTSDQTFFDYISVSKEGETLKLSTDFTLQARILKAKITMPALYSVSLSGASKGTVSGFQSTKDFSLDVSGASSLTINDTEVGDAEFEVSGASKVNGTLTANDLDFGVSGASGIELDGSGNNINADASGASTLNLAAFPLNNANVRLSGASEASVNLKGRLDCFLSSASRLYFQGNPVMGNLNVTGASTIKHR